MVMNKELYYSDNITRAPEGTLISILKSQYERAKYVEFALMDKDTVPLELEKISEFKVRDKLSDIRLGYRQPHESRFVTYELTGSVKDLLEEYLELTKYLDGFEDPAFYMCLDEKPFLWTISSSGQISIKMTKEKADELNVKGHSFESITDCSDKISAKYGYYESSLVWAPYGTWSEILNSKTSNVKYVEFIIKDRKGIPDSLNVIKGFKVRDQFRWIKYGRRNWFRRTRYVAYELTEQVIDFLSNYRDLIDYKDGYEAPAFFSDLSEGPTFWTESKASSLYAKLSAEELEVWNDRGLEFAGSNVDWFGKYN